MSTKFERKTEEWTDERLQHGFLDVRRDLMTVSPGNLITPTDDPLVYAHAPFSGSNYPYRKHVQSFQQPPWSDILAQSPADLIEPNPHAPSRFRPGGYACWDAAVGIPASLIRKSKIAAMRDTPIIRNTNAYWNQDVAAALQNVGPTGVPGIYKRPTGEYIIDFTQVEDGWFLLELAHALAHLSGDDKMTKTRLSKGVTGSKTTGHMQRWVATIAVALLFDLPMDFMPRDEGLFAQPDFPMIGLELKSSSYYDTPFMRVPTSNNEALRFDETLAVMSVGVFVQPHPYGFITGTLEAVAEDRWSCTPTIAIVAGWECVDVITHQPFIQRHPYGNEPECYGMHPRDLLPPDMFWGYLQLWRKRQRELGKSDIPKSDGRRFRVKEVVYSPLCERLMMNSPPRPCIDCMMWNNKTDGIPQRPRGMPPQSKAELAEKKNWEWRLYYRDVAAVFDIISRSTIEYEAKLYGVAEAKRIRRLRTKNWKDSLQVLKERGYVDTARKKIHEGKDLTRWEKRAYNAWKQERLITKQIERDNE